MRAGDTLPRPLGDGLVLRYARGSDAAELADFNALMHGDGGQPDESLAEWTRDLFELDDPPFRVEDDVTVVEDSRTKRIVSTLFLLPQTWSYAGVPMPVGQPELIATHPDHRRQGLVRTQFEVAHARSRELGQRWQIIGGIPWYYRQFGYTYALDQPSRPTLWLGRRAAESPPELTVRPATVADVAFLAAVNAAAGPGELSCVRSEATWAAHLRRRPGALVTCRVLILARAGVPIGYVAHPHVLHDGVVTVRAFELVTGSGWLEPTEAVLAHLRQWVLTHPDGPGRGVRLALPPGHPGLRSAATRLGAGPAGSYGRYVRVPDLAAFLRTAAPALERRLAGSPASGWTGELRIDLYTESLRLIFDEGSLQAVHAAGPGLETPDATLPVGAFRQLLMGNRTLSEVELATADCRLRTDVGSLLLDVLFPRLAYCDWPMG